MRSSALLVRGTLLVALRWNEPVILRAVGCRLCSSSAASSSSEDAFLVGGTAAEPMAADSEALLAGLPVRGSTPQPGHIYFVATPIGNLDDLTLRAVATLRGVDVVASEDTRRTSQLLRYLQCERKTHVSHHEHNTQTSVPKLLGYAAQGLSVAVVSDAGTPGISDPGVQLASAAAAQGIPLVPVPGACAAVAALCVSGFGSSEFVFGGFLPRQPKPLRERIAALIQEPRAVVIYEAPHRLRKTLAALESAGAAERGCLCARELTKMHEELFRGTISAAMRHFCADEEGEGQQVRGEFTIVLAPFAAEELKAKDEEARDERKAEASRLLEERIGGGERVSAAARAVAAQLGVARGPVYNLALQIKEKKQARTNESGQ